MEAHVSCPCHRDHRTLPHPHPHLLIEPLPGHYRLKDGATPSQEIDHEEWTARACSHSLMQAIYRFLWGADGRHILRQALRPGGPAGDRAALHALVAGDAALSPTPPHQAQEMLEEIHALRSVPLRIPVNQVVDLEQDRVLVEAPGSVLYALCGDGTQLGFGDQGLTLQSGSRILFATHRLQQEERPDGSYFLTPQGEPGRITHGAFTPYDAENPDSPQPLPTLVAWRQVERGYELLEPMLSPLAEVLAASVSSGNSVIWAEDD